MLIFSVYALCPASPLDHHVLCLTPRRVILPASYFHIGSDAHIVPLAFLQLLERKLHGLLFGD